MPDCIIKGVVVTEALSTGSIEAGAVCVIIMNGEPKRVTLMHVDSNEGQWIVEGDYTGPIGIFRTLSRFSVLGNVDSFPVVLKHWSKIIKHQLLGEQVLCKITPYKFKEGKNLQVCSECDSHFLASKSQPFCGNCCDKYSTATILETDKIITASKNQVTKNKPVAELITEAIIDVGMKAYYKAQEDIPIEEYNQWLHKQAKKWQ